jgi:hypothetical protein
MFLSHRIVLDYGSEIFNVHGVEWAKGSTELSEIQPFPFWSFVDDPVVEVIPVDINEASVHASVLWKFGVDAIPKDDIDTLLLTVTGDGGNPRESGRCPPFFVQILCKRQRNGNNSYCYIA